MSGRTDPADAGGQGLGGDAEGAGLPGGAGDRTRSVKILGRDAIVRAAGNLRTTGLPSSGPASIDTETRTARSRCRGGGDRRLHHPGTPVCPRSVSRDGTVQHWMAPPARYSTAALPIAATQGEGLLCPPCAKAALCCCADSPPTWATVPRAMKRGGRRKIGGLLLQAGAIGFKTQPGQSGV